jgi:hypothetical protein
MTRQTTTSEGKSGFGFDEIMRDPDYTRFMTWYAKFSLLPHDSNSNGMIAKPARPSEVDELPQAA